MNNISGLARDKTMTQASTGPKTADTGSKSTFNDMMKGVIVAYAIILASIPIPIVHFVTLPIGPFVAGFVGGGIAKADEAKITVFGLVVAGLALIPAAILLILSVAAHVTILGFPDWLVVGAAVALVPYTWFGVTIGALISYLFRRKESEAQKS